MSFRTFRRSSLVVKLFNGLFDFGQTVKSYDAKIDHWTISIRAMVLIMAQVWFVAKPRLWYRQFESEIHRLIRSLNWRCTMQNQPPTRNKLWINCKGSRVDCTQVTCFIFMKMIQSWYLASPQSRIRTPTSWYKSEQCSISRKPFSTADITQPVIFV